MFEVDEKCIIACVASELDDLGVGDKPHSEGLYGSYISALVMGWVAPHKVG